MNKNKKTIFSLIQKKEKYILYLLLITAIFLLSYPLISNKIKYEDDYYFHVTNLLVNREHINILKFKFLIPQIFSGGIANNLGYGTGIFYPPLSYYLTCYMSSLINSNKIIEYLQIIIIILSSLTMFKFLKKVTKDNYISTIGSISYISSIYFLTDIYRRFAIAESLTFIFIPIVFLGLYNIISLNNNKIHIFIIGYLGMIHCHLVISIYLTLIIIFLFLCFPKKILKKEIIKKLLLSSLIILLISSSYLIPLLEHKILGNYAVFEPNYMYTLESVKEHALSIKELLTIKTTGVKIYLNYIILILSIITIILNKKIFKKENNKLNINLYKVSLIITILSIFISSKLFPWEIMPNFLKMIQFPWRLLGLASFSLAILSGYTIKLIKEKYKLLLTIIISIFIVMNGYLSIEQKNNHNNLLMEDIPIPNEISLGVQSEYLPTKTINNIDYFKYRGEYIIIKEGKAKTTIIENNTPYLKSEIKLISDNITIELPRIYYLGYEIKLTDKEGNTKKIDYYENENGFIETKLNKSGILEINYKGTLANKIANYISILTIGICLSILLYKKYIKKILRKITCNKTKTN